MTAQEILKLHNAWCAADAERMSRRPSGANRTAWREENPIAPVDYPVMRDTAFKSRPCRFAGFIDHSGLLRISSHKKLIEIIDLKAPDADDRLARYEMSPR